MRDVDLPYLTALLNARELGIIPRFLVCVTGREFAGEDGVPGAEQTFSFWTGDDNIGIEVNSPYKGTVNRTFVGGVNLSLDGISRVSDLTIQTVSISFSQIADSVQNMVRGFDMRLGKVEIYEALFDPVTRYLVSTPPLTFLGEIDGAPIETPEEGGDGSVEVKCVSDAISMLTIKNPQKSSDAAQSRRDDDEFGKYSGVIKTWTVKWGQSS